MEAAVNATEPVANEAAIVNTEAPETAAPSIDEDLRGPLANFTAAGVHCGEAAGQAIKQFDAVETGKADLARNIDALLDQIEKAAGADHVVRVI